ncbi:MAG TPA: DUF3536 domain-containing protein, partial [Longimicrobiales bacterium]|nr:DUF3536 domain-containing protein [Longimicrobiales bacterium]
MDRRSVVVHGHFYQPPREDPWTGRVPLQPSAAPWHDWNERVHDECYRAVVAARILDERGRIAHVMNTLEWISWDAGPTLLDWMAAEEPATYRAFLEADRAARARTGHGNALASPYHHVILPLSTYREKVTEVRWGVTDFRRRFGRDPAGMWLPEAAVDTETLDVLAREGIAFTVLGPTQVRSVPAHGLPGRVRLPGGRSIAVFVYDGPLSHDVAFGQLLRNAAGWVERMAAVPGRLVALATDGETFGHHHRWGDMALAATLMMAGRRGLRLEGFAAFLERNPPVEEIEIVEPSSWSCVHGVERWRSDCGCKADPSKPTSQAWRRPLREGLDELAAALHTRYAQETGRWLGDPWALRDAYVSVLGLDARARAELVRRYASRPLSDAEVSRTLELLEAERDALRMLSSCAWFFDDVARIEPLQALHYAAHALHLVGSGAGALESRLLSRLRHAKSNDPAEGTAADLWRRKVRGVVRTDERRARRVTPAAVRAVARALASPTADSVDAALRAIDATPDGELLPVQTELARGLALRDEPGPELARLADRLGVAPDPGTGGLVRAEPLRFVVALHLHQPLGNFDSVIEQHVDEVYLPVLRRFEERGFLPLALHVSGPLLEWLEARAHRFLDLVGELAGRGALELLLAGFYEPVLPALSREDRLDQIGRMRRWLSSRFGVEARGLWLTERVWEPGLVGDLADAGVEHVFVDDRHLLASGFERHELARPWRALSGGRALAVLPIDERLRYMVPFRSAEEVARELRARAEKGRALAVLGDDGEKLGGWPGTAELVWGRGWLDAFLDEMERLVDEGAVRLASPAEALREVPPGKR